MQWLLQTIVKYEDRKCNGCFKQLLNVWESESILTFLSLQK